MMRATLMAVVCLVGAVQATGYDHIVRTLHREYSIKQIDYNRMAGAQRYQWEMLSVNEFPVWCNESATEGIRGEEIWVDGFGKVVLKGENDLYVAVRSWIDRDEDGQAQVVRLFRYRRSEGGWQRIETIKITQVWDQSCGWVCQR